MANFCYLKREKLTSGVVRPVRFFVNVHRLCHNKLNGHLFVNFVLRQTDFSNRSGAGQSVCLKCLLFKILLELGKKHLL